MDRGTIVIRQNYKGVVFEIFDVTERAKAEARAKELFDNGEDPHICVNLQELKEAEPGLKRLLGGALMRLAKLGDTEFQFNEALPKVVKGPLFELVADGVGTWLINEDGSIQGFPEGTIVVNNATPYIEALKGQIMANEAVNTIVEMMSESALQISNKIAKSVLDGRLPELDFDELTIIVAALRKQL